MRKMMLYTGAALILIGIGSADSPSLLAPLLLIGIGALMVKSAVSE